MSTPSHQPATATTQAGLSSPHPAATRQGAGSGNYLVVIDSSEYGRVESPSSTLQEAIDDFESAERCACNSPDFQDVIQVTLIDPAGAVVRRSPKWA